MRLRKPRLDPHNVIIMGDTHGNWTWISTQLYAMRSAVPAAAEGTLTVLHLGDAMWWPGSEVPERVAKLAHSLNMKIWVTPGNHEDPRSFGKHEWICAYPVNDSRTLVALKRGTRWQWHGRTWLSVGGAVSPDREHRISGVSWWPEEEVSDDEVASVVKDGPADVLLTHDVGASVKLNLPPWPRSWGADTAMACHAHRKRLDELANGTRPQWWFHGHYHLFHQQMVQMRHGLIAVTGLSLDGSKNNWGVFDTKAMKFTHFNK